MALIEKMKFRQQISHNIHGLTECTHSLFDHGNRRFLQIDTYGSATRKCPGKASQKLQFGPEGIEEIKRISANMMVKNLHKR